MGKKYCACVVRIGAQTGTESVAWQLFVLTQPVPLARCYIICVTKIFFLKMLRGLEHVLIGQKLWAKDPRLKGCGG